MSGQPGCRVVGEDILWQLCVESVLVCPWCAWVGGFGRISVQYRYTRAEELRELRRRRMFFREVNDLFRITLVCSVQRKSCWKMMPKWRCLRATVSSCSSK